MIKVVFLNDIKQPIKSQKFWEKHFESDTPYQRKFRFDLEEWNVIWGDNTNNSTKLLKYNTTKSLEYR